MSHLVTGGTGQLGTAFRLIGLDAEYPPRSELDLADIDTLDARLEAAAPTGIINCAAYTNVDKAEEEEALATRVNGSAVGKLSAYAARHAIPFVTFSTDYVFDGTNASPYIESSPTNPINAYGRSKLAGERLALTLNPASLVVRTSWVISETHRNFVATMLDLVRSGEVQVVRDQQGCPTIASDLARATLQLLDQGASGIIHMASLPATTWFELARTAVTYAGLDSDRIRPCTTADYPRPARRPPYSVLGSERLERLGVGSLPDWRDSLREVVAAMEKARPD